MKYINLVYFVFAVFILAFACVNLFGGIGKTWANLVILAIGIYFLYRGVTVTVNEKRRRALENEDNSNDPANS